MAMTTASVRAGICLVAFEAMQDFKLIEENAEPCEVCEWLGANLEDAMAIAEKLRHAIETPLRTAQCKNEILRHCVEHPEDYRVYEDLLHALDKVEEAADAEREGRVAEFLAREAGLDGV
jgi:hypothetical protein